MESSHSPEPWMTLKAAAEQLDVSVDTVRRAAVKGTLRSYKTPGGNLRIIASSVDKMLAERHAA